MLDLFWQSHDPTLSRSSQYRAELFCADGPEAAVYRESAERIAATLNRPLGTRIVPGRPFFPAEDYHQKWTLRRHKLLWSELLANYANEAEALSSVAAAKLNGYAAGHGPADLLLRDMDDLGLSTSGKDYLRGIANQSKGGRRSALG